MKDTVKKILIIITTVIFIFAVLFLIQRLFMPKYVSEVVEGNLIAEYYDDEPDHDVVFIGDCEVYENFSPAVLWDEYGINSFIRGSAQQLIWQSYYLLEDTLKYEKPDVVIFNVLALQYNEPQREAYNRMTIDGMRWSLSKVNSIKASMMEDEEFLDYVFPILRYHSRWSELSSEDVKYMFDREQVSHNGYYMRVDVRPVTTIPEGKVLGDYTFGDNAYKYMDMITNLCKENDIELILIKAPSIYPIWYDEWDEQMVDYANQNGLTYINFLDLIDETGIDWNTDTYDAGLHMNLSGAEKITRYLGEVLSKEKGLQDRHSEDLLNKSWEDKLAFYNSEKTRMYAELNEEN